MEDRLSIYPGVQSVPALRAAYGCDDFTLLQHFEIPIEGVGVVHVITEVCDDDPGYAFSDVTLQRHVGGRLAEPTALTVSVCDSRAGSILLGRALDARRTAQRCDPGRAYASGRCSTRTGTRHPTIRLVLAERALRPEPSRLLVGNIPSMSDTGDPITILSESESWNLLASVALGRLVTCVDGQAEIFPVNFVVQRHTVLFRTAEGTKLVSTAINNRVVFEADEHTVGEGWSVIVKGMAHALHTDEEIDEAEQAQLLPWTATTKRHYVRLLPTQITGRRFRFGPEPDE